MLRNQTQSRRSHLLGCLAGFSALTPLGCGEGAEEYIETEREGLGSFGSWSNMGGIVKDGPALAKTAGTTLTAFAHGTDFRVWTTAQNASGQWTGGWTQVPGRAFVSRPAAVGIGVTSGPLVDHFIIAANGGDGKFWVRIQNQSGSSVPFDWFPIDLSPFFTMTSPPALTFVPASNVTDPLAAIFIAGRASENGGRIGLAVNRLNNNNYVHSNWQFMGAPVLLASTEPALTYVPPFVKGHPYVTLSAGQPSGSFVSYRISRFAGFGVSPQPWSPWSVVPNGLFLSGPALAAGNQGEFGSETVLFGRGTDSRIYVTNNVSSGSFSPILPGAFRGSPVAFGFGNKVVVGATTIDTAVPFSNTANSPF